MSGTYRSHCRPGTGTASPNRQAPTGATASSMNRSRTDRRPPQRSEMSLEAEGRIRVLHVQGRATYVGEAICSAPGTGGTQWWRVAVKYSTVGAGKSGSTKFPTAIPVMERPSKAKFQKTVDPHVAQKL